jgi:hypothetical protein
LAQLTVSLIASPLGQVSVILMTIAKPVKRVTVSLMAANAYPLHVLAVMIVALMGVELRYAMRALSVV